MEKYFDFEEAINCIKNDIPVQRVGSDGITRIYYMDPEGNYRCKLEKEGKSIDYILSFNKLLKANDYTYETCSK